MALLILTAAWLAGCAAYDLGFKSDLTATADGFYQWRTMADATQPLDSDRAEQARLSYMRDALAKQPDCQAGYSVTDRQVVVQSVGAFGTAADVIYTIRC